MMVGSHHLKELLMWMVKSSCRMHVPTCVCVCVCFSSVDLYEFEKAGAHPCIGLLKLAGPQYIFTRFLLASRRYSIMEMGWACD